MTQSWIIDSIGTDNVRAAVDESSRRRLRSAFGSTDQKLPEEKLQFAIGALELRVFELLEQDDDKELRRVAAEVFQIARSIPLPENTIEAAESLLQVTCLGVLGDRGADVRRILLDRGIPELNLNDDNWGHRVWANILNLWLRLYRKNGWDDFNSVQAGVVALRKVQNELEPKFLNDCESRKDARPAWQLMAEYHLAKAAEILGSYLSQGSVDGKYDVREQLEAQFDRALAVCQHGQLLEIENLTRLLARSARCLVDNSIWTVTRAVNSRVTKFVKELTNRSQPIFEMLPPQRRTLREEGLLGSGHRSVVVSLPTSSGKTLIAQFRILQALNQFDQERGWVAFLAPTRVLVNQLTLRLRRDFTPLGISVEKVSPALEIDGIEADVLTEVDQARQFRVLVSTPEKLDLMLRGGWEQKIGRPLTLIVVDEAHGLSSSSRGLKLELLLATINRECKFAQFLLLTPFIRNASEIARWLAPDSNKCIDLGIDWRPNDCVIAIAEPVRGTGRGEFAIRFQTQHTSRNTLTVPEAFSNQTIRPLGLTWSQVKNSPGKLAAATTEILKGRGTVIVLVGQPDHSWGIAKSLCVDANRITRTNADFTHIRTFLADEMGDDFPLIAFLDHGIGVHHTGLSDDTRTLVEWLTERSYLNALVATTTIAQGVNFPVSGVVFASHQYPFGQDMPPEDFWNIAGRAGRVDQGDLGIVALAGTDPERTKHLQDFINNKVGELNSTLIDMVQFAVKEGKLSSLEELSWEPSWSAFLQYLAHTYRQMGNHDDFAAQIEQVLRGTLGFQSLRKTHKGWADKLVAGVHKYAERIKGKPLKLVDSTGFSWESVSNTLYRIGEAKLTNYHWSDEIFGERRKDLQRMMGVLLQVPELREKLSEVTGGPQPDGETLSRIICDWVNGRPLREMATEYFVKSTDETGVDTDPVSSMTKCCQSIFGRLTQTASWGLSALQTLTIGDSLENLPASEQRSIRNLPSRVYYGVDSDEAVALRLLGVPRSAAKPLSNSLKITAEDSLGTIRAKLAKTTSDDWKQAIGPNGQSFRRVWEIVNGD